MAKSLMRSVITRIMFKKEAKPRVRFRSFRKQNSTVEEFTISDSFRYADMFAFVLKDENLTKLAGSKTEETSSTTPKKNKGEKSSKRPHGKPRKGCNTRRSRALDSNDEVRPVKKPLPLTRPPALRTGRSLTGAVNPRRQLIMDGYLERPKCGTPKLTLPVDSPIRKLPPKVREESHASS